MLDVEVDAFEAESLLGGIADRIEQPRSLLSALSGELVDHERDAFATNGFGEWAPLHPATIARKGSSRILVDTGSLMAALTRPSSVRIDSDAATITAAGIDYAKFHAGRRNPTPEPPRERVEQWADSILDGLVPR